MAVENLTATGLTAEAPVSGHGFAKVVKVDTKSVEVSSAASSTSTYWMHRLPSDARILGTSVLDIDDLASTGSPTLDIGAFAVAANITDDDDALNDGIDAATAGQSTIVKTIDNYGKELWEFVNGQTTDPGGFIDIKITIKDADTNTGGTMVSTVFYTLD